MSALTPSAKSAEITVPTETDNVWTVKVIAPDGSETAIDIPDNQVGFFAGNGDAVASAIWLAYTDRWVNCP